MLTSWSRWVAGSMESFRLTALLGGSAERTTWLSADEALSTPMTRRLAFNGGKLEAVAKGYRERYPVRALLVAGDNDHRKELELGQAS